MTNHSTALAELFGDADIESLRSKAVADLGIDILGVYCLHTGRKVGTFDPAVIQFAIEEEPSDDEDTLIDSLVCRVVASMRPSPMLNLPDRITLVNLSSKFPVDILSYLANRLLSNRWLATHRDSSLLDPYIARITLHERWTNLAASGVDLRPWIHWLLELDSKRNLHDVSPPQVSLDRLNNWIVTADGVSLFHLVTEENQAQMLEVFEKWAFKRLEEYNKRDAQAEAEARWMRGNRMSQPAYTRSWLENPDIAQKKEVMKRPLRDSGKSRKAQPKVDPKLAKFLGLLDEVLDGTITVSPPKPKAKVLTGNMLFQKKES